MHCFVIKRAMYLAIYVGMLGLTSGHAAAQWHYFKGESMTTSITLSFWWQDVQQAQAIKQEVFEGFDDIYHRMSGYLPDSELSRLNRLASQQPIRVSQSLFMVLEQAQALSRLSEGAFDMTFASVGYEYDYRKRLQPSADFLSTQVALIDYRSVSLKPETRQVKFQKNGVKVGLGGIAKGYAVDRAIEKLKSWGVKHAQVSAGGDLRLLGDKRGRDWRVGIKDPRQQALALTLPLSDIAVSTSGDYERFFINEKGDRIHHIISPKTGRPVQGIQSVTVIGPSATKTDGLATAIFVLGFKRGLDLLNDLPAYDAVVIDAQRKVHYSSGLAQPGL